MKLLFVAFSFLIASSSFAAIDTITISGKVVSFDGNTVTIEFVGTNYKFKREKLGQQFSNLKKGETVAMVIDKKTLTK